MLYQLTFSLLLAASLVSAAPLRRPEAVSVPIKRNTAHLHRRSTNLASWAQNSGAHLVAKYGSGSGVAKRDLGAVALQNGGDNTEFFGAVEIGTPPQTLSVILDTGSADLWAASTSCTTCNGVTTYSPSQSSTATTSTTPFSITYGSGSASGTLIKETITMGGYSVTGAALGVVTNQTGILQPALATVSGIMGFGFQSISSSKSPPFWQVLQTADVLPAAEFSFALASAKTSAEQQNGGILTLGGTNSSLYQGQITYTAVTTAGFVTPPSPSCTLLLTDTTSFPVANSSRRFVRPSDSFTLISTLAPPSTGVVVNKAQLVDSNITGSAAIDTGTTLIGGPTAAIREIFSKIPGSQAGTGQYAGYWMYPCTSTPQVSLTFSGVAYPIDAATFNLGSTGNGLCLAPLFELASLGTSAGLPQWIVGASFLMGVYSTFRASPVPSVGFAALSSSFSSTAQTPTTVSIPATTAGGGVTASKGANAAAATPTGPSAAGPDNAYVQSHSLQQKSSAAPKGGRETGFGIEFGIAVAVGISVAFMV